MPVPLLPAPRSPGQVHWHSQQLGTKLMLKVSRTELSSATIHQQQHQHVFRTLMFFESKLDFSVNFKVSPSKLCSLAARTMSEVLLTTRRILVILVACRMCM